MSLETDVLAGVSAGVARFLREVDQKSPLPGSIGDVQRQVFELAVRMMKDKPQWPPRGIQFFVEILTTGVLSRWRFEEPPLSDEQIFRFIGEIELFENCWFHLKLP